MTRHDDMLYVALMRDEVRAAMDTVGGRSLEEFAADRTGADVVAYHFMRLETRPLKASEAFRDAHPEVPWLDLAEIRDRVEDEHFHVDAAEVWRIVTEELPAILEDLEALLPPDELWRYRWDRGEDEELVWPETEPDVSPRVPIPMDALDEICRRYDVRRIRFCGSVLRDDFGPESDIDMMIELGPGAPAGWDVFRLDEELSELFGRKADVMHGKPVRYIREQMLAEAKTVYVAEPGRVGENGAQRSVQAKSEEGR